MTTAEDAQKHLYSKVFLPERAAPGMTLENLAMVLLRIAVAASTVVTAEACRAVALLLERRRGDRALENLNTEVKKLVTSLEAANTRVSTVGGAKVAENMLTAASVLTSTVQEQCEDIKVLTGRLEDGFTEILERTKGTTDTTDNRPQTRTYAMAATPTPPPEYAAAVASAAASTREILIERAPDTQDWLIRKKPPSLI
ncbi:hypothetical protein B0H13DRAFT_2300821 [Mycena leptocephala]|nr:hypothetical protein B0H13DRAFT_2300821 [Mycena leptocephala]